MPIKYRNTTKDSLDNKFIEAIPIIFSYKYLGITIDCNGSIEPHILYLKKRLKYLKTKIVYN